MMFLDKFIPLISAYCVPFSGYLFAIFIWLVPFGILGIFDSLFCTKFRRD